MEATASVLGNQDPQTYVALLRDRIGLDAVETIIPNTLAESLAAFIWDIRYINAEPTFLRRLQNDINITLMNGNLEEKKRPNPAEDNNNEDQDNANLSPSDVRDLLEFKPTEIIADKCTLILVSLCLGENQTCFEELESLKSMLELQCVKLHHDNYIGFWFIARTLECFVNFITREEDEFIFANSSEYTDKNGIPNIKAIPEKSRIAVNVAKCLFGRHVRHATTERMELMKQITVEDPTNFEWFITYAEMSRKKRRDAITHVGAKKSIQEEYDLVGEALILAPENPYVQLSVLDCVVDCLRETKGAFKCGELVFEGPDEAIQYMRCTSKKLLEDFPNSVKIHSQISDTFCRLVSYRFFDIPLAERCLTRAYDLNPKNPKTTHRLGIFTRMSKGDIESSYKWFQKTIELNPMHFNASMEVIKNKLARPEEEEIIKYLDKLISSAAVSCWTEHEILELLFYKGLAHFALDNKEKALEIWKIVAEKNDSWFRLNDLDRTCGFYYWNDKQISSDKLRIWVNEEKKLVAEAGDSAANERKKLIELLFSLMIGGGYPSRPCPNSGPFQPSKTYQLIKPK